MWTRIESCATAQVSAYVGSPFTVISYASTAVQVELFGLLHVAACLRAGVTHASDFESASSSLAAGSSEAGAAEQPIAARGRARRMTLRSLWVMAVGAQCNRGAARKHAYRGVLAERHVTSSSHRENS